MLEWRRMRLGRVICPLLAIAALAGAALAQDLPARCTDLTRPDRDGRFIALADLARPASALDGDEPLVLVDRSPQGALPPSYAPDDLVDLATMRPTRPFRCLPPRTQCLRRDAARDYRAMARAMRDDGLSPHVSSAFRRYQTQCSTFSRWVRRGALCEAATASALPGHSQHQLGTALDLFTYEWTNAGDKFRPGFGCTPGGRWIAAHAHEHGFVLPYPLHPDLRRDGSDCAAVDGGEERVDPRTGYRYEPWHLRWVGRERAAEFRAARAASEPGTARELTPDQWLRARRGEPGTVGVPVCDGCNCDRCATFADDGPCETPAWALNADGSRPEPAHPPRIESARLERDSDRVVVVATVRVAQNTATQGPVVTEASGAWYRRGRRPTQLADGRARRFAPIEGAYRLVIGFDRRDDWPWGAALVAPSRSGVMNGVHAPFAAAPGTIEVRVPIEGLAAGTRVRLGVAHGARVDAVAWSGGAP